MPRIMEIPSQDILANIHIHPDNYQAHLDNLKASEFDTTPKPPHQDQVSLHRFIANPEQSRIITTSAWVKSVPFPLVSDVGVRIDITDLENYPPFNPLTVTINRIFFHPLTHIHLYLRPSDHSITHREFGIQVRYPQSFSLMPGRSWQLHPNRQQALSAAQTRLQPSEDTTFLIGNSLESLGYRLQSYTPTQWSYALSATESLIEDAREKARRQNWLADSYEVAQEAIHKSNLTFTPQRFVTKTDINALRFLGRQLHNLDI